MFTKYKFFLFSQDPDTLLKFYTDTLGLKVTKSLNLPKDYGYMLEIAPGYEVWLAKHSEVIGPNTENLRHMLNIYTTDFDTLYQRLKSHPQAKFVQELISMSEFIPGESRRVMTLLDPEGNCLQFMSTN